MKPDIAWCILDLWMYTFGDGVENPLHQWIILTPCMLWNYSFTSVCHFSLCYIESAVLLLGENGKSIQLFVELTVCIYALDVDVFDARVHWNTKAIADFPTTEFTKSSQFCLLHESSCGQFNFMHVAALCCDSAVCLVLSLVRKASGDSGLADGWRMSEWWWRVCVT